MPLVRFSRERTPKEPRGRGVRITCSRCGDWTRVPRAAAYDGCAPVLCGGCVMDDIDEAVRRRPSPRLYGMEHDLARWTEGEIPTWSNQGRTGSKQ